MRKLGVLLSLGLVLLAAPSPARAELVYASTSGGRLLAFDSATPGTLLTNVAISGVAGSLIGIDFRPAAVGVLYGVGNNGGVGTVYIIDRTTGAATPVYTLMGTNFTGLVGTSFGVDFNPVPDALRIVSDAGQNLRIAGFPSSTFVTNVDGALNPAPGAAMGAAYINNFRGTLTTTLYDINTTTDQLFIQNPPNSGGLMLVGPLNIDTNNLIGFDVSGATGIAFASLNGGSNFGTVNLATGAYTNIGAIGGFAGQITGMSVATVPEPSSMVLLGLGALGMAQYVRRRRQVQA